jgi:DNA repair exonuclease SbcCD ATPase subunit
MIRREVDSALERLDSEEKELIKRHYFVGQGWREIEEESGRTRHKIQGLRRRAMKKLRKALAPFVEREYGIETGRTDGCPVCSSIHRHDIEKLISDRAPTSAWRPLTSILRSKYGIRIPSPRILIVHEKYH